MAKKLKPIYHVYTCFCGEQDFFFDQKFNLLTWWDLNDAHFRHEYMTPLLKGLGFEVVNAEARDPRFFETIKASLIESCGASDEDFE